MLRKLRVQVVVQTTTILQQRCSLQLIQSSFRHLR